MNKQSVVIRYRNAAIRLYGLSLDEAESTIVHPEADKGEWAPKSKAIIYLETGHLLPLEYYAPCGIDECVKLSEAAGYGYIEYINAAVAAVYE